MTTESVKSVEIFCHINELPGELRSFLLDNGCINWSGEKTTIRIYEDVVLMEIIWHICDKFNIRCQRYSI